MELRIHIVKTRHCSKVELNISKASSITKFRTGPKTIQKQK